MANSVAPDSWEQQADNNGVADGPDKSVESKFSTLNVNAAEFVPSFCISSTPAQAPAPPPPQPQPQVLDEQPQQQAATASPITETAPAATTTTAGNDSSQPESPSQPSSPLLDEAAAAAVTANTSMPPETHHDTDTPTVPPDPVVSRDEDPPAGGGAPPPTSNAGSLNASPEHQPADSWEEAAVDGDPLLTPVCSLAHFPISTADASRTNDDNLLRIFSLHY